MNELQLFNSNEFGEIRTVMIESEVWFGCFGCRKSVGV